MRNDKTRASGDAPKRPITKQHAKRAIRRLKRADRKATQHRDRRPRFLRQLYRCAKRWSRPARAPLMTAALDEGNKTALLFDEMAMALLKKTIVDRRARYKYNLVLKWADSKNIKIEDFEERLAKAGGINKCIKLYRKWKAGKTI